MKMKEKLGLWAVLGILSTTYWTETSTMPGKILDILIAKNFNLNF